MRSKTCMILVLVFALLLPAYAAEQELIPQPVCSCGLTVESFKVVNDQNKVANYALELSGDAAPYAVAYPPVFTLPPGGAIDVNVDLHFPCDEKGYVLSIRVNEIGGKTKTLTKAYITQACPNIQVYTKEAAKSAYPCQATTFRFDITNAGSEKDVFTFSLAEENEYVTLSSKGVQLGSGQTHTLYANAEFGCAISGPQKLSLITETQGSALKATTPFVLEIVPVYDYTLTVPDDIELCEQLEQDITLELENEQPFMNGYAVSLEGADWLPKSSSLMIEGDSDGTMEFSLLAPEGSAGEYTIDVNTVSAAGELTKTESFDITVASCYAIEMVLPVNRTRICCDEMELPVEISNSGTEDLELALVLESDMLELEDEILQLVAGDTETIYLSFGDTCAEAGTYSFTLTATPEDAEAFETSLAGTYEFFATEDCSRLEVLQTEYKVNYRRASFDVPLKNVGAKDTYYSFTLSAGDWEFLETFDMNLAPGETGDIRVYIEPQDIPEDTYALELTATTAGGETFSFPLMLTLTEKFRFSDMIWETYVYMVNYSCSFTYRILGIVFLVALLLLVALAIWKGKTRKVRRRARLKKSIWWLFYLLIVIVLGLGVAFMMCNYGLEPVTTYLPDNGTAMETPDEVPDEVPEEIPEGVPGELPEEVPEEIPAEPEEVPDEPEEVPEEVLPEEHGFTLAIPEGKDFTLNLTDIFTDPDADVLYYTIIGPSSLDIDVDNDRAIATVSVVGQFEEGSEITVTVSDGEYTVASPPIRLVYADETEDAEESDAVVEESPTNIINGIYVYAFLVLIIIILFVRVLYDQRKEKPKKKLTLSDLKGAPQKKRRKKK